MSPTTQRTLQRRLHIVPGLLLFGFVCVPTEEVAQYAPMFRYFFMPVLLLTGLWMWKGAELPRLPS